MTKEALKILHIEDRRENRILVRKLLEARQFQVIDAEDGLTGLELARRSRVDLILLDINIPGLDGYEVVTRLKGEPRLASIPVVAITAEGDRERALALGFDGFIMKPIKIARFVRDLRAFIGGKRERGEEADRATHLMEQNRRVVDHLEEKLRALTQANERLREVDRLKMEVLRNLSHELSTPMTPLLGYTKMLAAEELGPIHGAQAKVLERMNGSLLRLKGLIDNLLKVTRFATGGISLERSALLPSDLLQAILEAHSAAAEAQGLSLEVELQARELVLVDAEHLQDAWSQILDNAIKFSPSEGRIQLSARLLQQREGEASLLELAVTDEGLGIPADQREQVIQPFYQIDGSVTRSYGGAGLGLAIAERVAKLHGGRLIITETISGGARVALQIPSRPSQEVESWSWSR